MKKITVALPTISGRGRYLEKSLKTCVLQDQDFEILVSDNPGGEARDIAESFNDPRIRYITPPSYLPMSAHWDFVLSKVAGDFVSFIGDDDGLMPGCISRVIDIASQVGDMPIHHSLANYYWPDCVDQINRNATVFFHDTGWGEKTVQSKEFLRNAAKAKARYVDGPMVYHNFIPTKLLRRLTVDGQFFRRAAPDVYSSIAVAANTSTFFTTNELLTISGQGSKANGAKVKAGVDNGFLSEAKLNYQPRFNSVTVQMALLDSIIEVAKHFELKDLLLDIDYPSHFAMSYSEARAMKGRLRIDEFKFSLLRWNFPAIAFKLLAGKVHRIRCRVLSSSVDLPINIAFRSGDLIPMPNETLDIFDAIKALSLLLKTKEVTSKG